MVSLGTLFHSEWQATVQEGGAETCSSSQGLVLELGYSVAFAHIQLGEVNYTAKPTGVRDFPLLIRARGKGRQGRIMDK